MYCILLGTVAIVGVFCQHSISGLLVSRVVSAIELWFFVLPKMAYVIRPNFDYILRMILAC